MTQNLNGDLQSVRTTKGVRTVVVVSGAANNRDNGERELMIKAHTKGLVIEEPPDDPDVVKVMLEHGRHGVAEAMIRRDVFAPL